MQLEVPPSAVGEEAFQCVVHRTEGDFIPRYFRFVHQDGLEGLFAGVEVEVQQAGTLNDVELADVGNIH